MSIIPKEGKTVDGQEYTIIDNENGASSEGCAILLGLAVWGVLFAILYWSGFLAYILNKLLPA